MDIACQMVLQILMCCANACISRTQIPGQHSCWNPQTDASILCFVPEQKFWEENQRSAGFTAIRRTSCCFPGSKWFCAEQQVQLTVGNIIWYHLSFSSTALMKCFLWYGAFMNNICRVIAVQSLLHCQRFQSLAMNLAVKILLWTVQWKHHKCLGKWCEVSWFDLAWCGYSIECTAWCLRAFSFQIWKVGVFSEEKRVGSWNAITSICVI